MVRAGNLLNISSEPHFIAPSRYLEKLSSITTIPIALATALKSDSPLSTLSLIRYMASATVSPYSEAPPVPTAIIIRPAIPNQEVLPSESSPVTISLDVSIPASTREFTSLYQGSSCQRSPVSSVQSPLILPLIIRLMRSIRSASISFPLTISCFSSSIAFSTSPGPPGVPILCLRAASSIFSSSLNVFRCSSIALLLASSRLIIFSISSAARRLSSAKSFCQRSKSLGSIQLPDSLLTHRPLGASYSSS